MTFRPHTLVTFGGQLGYNGAVTAIDRWQCGIRVATDLGAGGLGPMPALDQYMGLVGPAIKSVFTTGSGSYAAAASDCSLDFVKCANVDVDGKYMADNLSPQLYTTGLPVSGASGRVGTPMQALKLTWVTARSRGRGHIGGIYMPFIGYSGWNTSTISAAAQTSYRDWGKAFLAAVHQTTPADNQTAIPVIASRLDASLTPITGVKVGNVIDVQRRRKEQVVETYSAVAVFP